MSSFFCSADTTFLEIPLGPLPKIIHWNIEGEFKSRHGGWDKVRHTH